MFRGGGGSAGLSHVPRAAGAAATRRRAAQVGATAEARGGWAGGVVAPSARLWSSRGSGGGGGVAAPVPGRLWRGGEGAGRAPSAFGLGALGTRDAGSQEPREAPGRGRFGLLWQRGESGAGGGGCRGGPGPWVRAGVGAGRRALGEDAGAAGRRSFGSAVSPRFSNSVVAVCG